MNKDILQGNWKEIKGKVKSFWGDLTDDDVAAMNGNYEELSGNYKNVMVTKRSKRNKKSINLSQNAVIAINL